MNFAWKFMLPMALINIVVAGVWRFSAEWALPGGGAARWVLCGALLAVPYALLGRALEPRITKRVYRYAD
jgi:NADH-quinone oxidoreductase subunit H